MGYREVSMTMEKIVAGLSVTLTFAGAALAEGKKVPTTRCSAHRCRLRSPTSISKVTRVHPEHENIDRVLKTPTSLGFVQLDIYANEASKRPEEFENSP
jgi:hypothetical protein